MSGHTVDSGSPRLIRRRLAGFSRQHWPKYELRQYQLDPAAAIVESVLRQQGRQMAVVFSRQAGKDEMLAQVVAYLLHARAEVGGTIVLAAPTAKPQAALMRERLLERLADVDSDYDYKFREGYIAEVGAASARFLSASPVANVRGQTADLLLVANEAQDIAPNTWDAAFDPMAATTNATTLFLGTVWSRETLLARQMRHFEEQARTDGRQRIWKVAWEQVAEILPPYGDRVRERIAQLGRDHAYIKTEYFLEELDSAGGLFPEQVLAQLQGDHQRIHAARPGRRYALLIDVAGEAETPIVPGHFDAEGRRDSTAVTVVEVDPAEISRESGSPVYRVVDRLAWTGARHVSLHQKIVDLARNVWNATVVVVDATGIGAGLASFLEGSLGNQQGITVIPFRFTSASKSRLGWSFLGLIETGRFKDYTETATPGSPEALLTDVFWSQMRAVTYTTEMGPGLGMKWSVPAGQGHDDLVMSAALVVELEEIDWRLRRAKGIVRN